MALTLTPQEVLRGDPVDANKQPSAAELETLLEEMRAEVTDINVTATTTVTVGAGGDYANVNDALEFLSLSRPSYASGGLAATVSLLTGFTMAEQVLVKDVDLSWITITSVDAEVTVTRSALTTIFLSTQNKYPVIGVHRGRGPNINVLFNMDTSGTATSRCGVVVTDGGFIHVGAGYGVKNAADIGLYCNRFSRASAHQSVWSGAGVSGIDCNRSSAVDAALCDVSSAGSYGLFCTRNSTIEAQSGSDATGAGISAVYASISAKVNCPDILASGAGGDAIWVATSIVNARQADVSGATLSGIRADETSIVNCYLADASGAGAYGVLALRGSIVNAQQVDADGAGSDGFYASASSNICATSATAIGCTGVGLRAESGSLVNCESATFTGCDNAIYCANGANVSASNATLTGSTGAYGVRCASGARLNVQGANCQKGGSPVSSDISCVQGATINAGSATGGLSITANTPVASGIIFQ